MPDIESERFPEVVHTLLMSDAMTGNHDGTPEHYIVDAENVEYLVATVLNAAADLLNVEAVNFQRGWGSNQHDQDRLWGIGAAISWLRGEDIKTPGKSE